MFTVYHPHSNHQASAACLDDDRLWTQLHDSVLLCEALAMDAPKTKALAVKQWRGYEGYLLLFIRQMQLEAQRRDLGVWVDDERRGPYAHAWLAIAKKGLPQAPRPPRWMGGLWFLHSQRSQLIRMAPEHYAHQFPTTPLDMPLLYPQNRADRFDYTVDMSRRDKDLLWGQERVIPSEYYNHLVSKGLSL